MRTHHIDRPADLDVVRESYDRVADNYAHMVVTTGMGDIRSHPWLEASIDAFAHTVSGLGPVLDVGCGPGTVTAYLAERGLDVSGVDLSPRMIANARRLHPQCRFSGASATELDLDEASLGGVLGWWSLFNLPRTVLPQVLASFARSEAGWILHHRYARRRRRRGAHRGIWRRTCSLDDPQMAAGATGGPGRAGWADPGCRTSATRE